MSKRVPLAVLDLVPISTGSDATTALSNSLDLARQAERSGYKRYWLAEHHLNPGLAGSAPLSFLGILAAATDRIRVGTAATLVGHYSPVQIAEAVGTVATLFDGRVDLGLGRTGGVSTSQPVLVGAVPTKPGIPPAQREARTVGGLYLPAPVNVAPGRGRFGLLSRLIDRQSEQPFAEAVRTILACLDGSYRDPDGELVPVLPARGSSTDVWIHGSSAGESARVAGRLGLPFGANHHSTPSTVLDSVAEYRAHFVPGRLPRPHVIVSADVLVAETDSRANYLAEGFSQWVHSVRTGEGTIEYPSPEEALADPLDPAALSLVQDRLDTRFVGSPDTVVAQLETIQRVTAADELLITTIAHDHEDRAHSYALLADSWLR
ncbi:LLM class flavin-dependent oxidoreductase [Arthrobacter sp. H-02-3]|uniref:LLM class flavin-dependent oxidoreductase n=1 Tax=Arthrobacter sp. H-02-3 TaxID=2703675 RepID=UPI000DD288F9|nr:LLM class flavin-dependent oxidoreductase [Arthrobacter sp. H-02-3]PVZ53845.1 LLM class flavin-dependent oxidoreductase [Arthrobacter sp. H-02-3]